MTETIVQLSHKTDSDVSEYIADASEDGTFITLRRGEGEEWTYWCRGEPLVDILDTENGYVVDLHHSKQAGVVGCDITTESLTLDYDVAEHLYLALAELFNNQPAGKPIVRRFEEVS